MLQMRSLASPLVKEASLFVDRLVPTRTGITFLLYHRVGVGSGSVIDLSPDEFARQMRVVRDEYRPLTIDEAVGEISGADVVRPGIVITFDDATTDFVDHALPILDELGLPSTLYVATGLVGSDRPWPDGGLPITHRGLETVAACDLVTLGSHTHTHKLLDRLDVASVADEIDRSIESLGEWCGIVARHFAYPKAVPPASAAAAAVAERFATAALATPGPNGAGQDLQRLRRTPIQATDDERHLRAKFAGGMATEARLRAGVNRVRYRGRTD